MMNTNDRYDQLIKILLLGDSSVGKSSLLLRFCEDKFENTFTLTIGVDFKSQIIEYRGKRYKLQIWDTAGQERFRTITPAYFRSAMGVILTYDITNIETFENLNYWIENLESYSDKSVVKILVGNKKDLQFMRQVSEQRGKILAKEYGIPFFETSAKNNLGVDDLFNYIAKMIIESSFIDRDTSNSSTIDSNSIDLSLSNIKYDNKSDQNRSKSLKCCQN